MISDEFEYLKFKMGKEYLPDVFGTVINTFPDIKTAEVSESRMLIEVLWEVKYSLFIRIPHPKHLPPKKLDGKENPAYSKFKGKLSAVTYNATFELYKDLKHPHIPTGLMFLDIDGFSTTDETKSYRNSIIKKYNWIIACNLSLSQLGIHLIIQVDRIIDNDDYNKKYDYINISYFDSKLDKNAKSLTRYTILPADYNIFINEHPSSLNIDEIFNSNISNTCISSTNNSKGYKEDYKIRNDVERRNIISTNCTFFNSETTQKLYKEGMSDGLIFEMPINESLFNEPDVPIYYPEGKWVVEINLNPFKNKKVNEGRRTITLGGITMQMIYLNAKLPNKHDYKVKYAILNFIRKINTLICNPPLSDQEVINSFNSNWNRFLDKKLCFDNCFILKRAFWSKRSTISNNDKRKITCAIKSDVMIKETHNKIKDAIQKIHNDGEKVTQLKVAELSGKSIRTVKTYWSAFENYVRDINSML